MSITSTSKSNYGVDFKAEHVCSEYKDTIEESWQLTVTMTKIRSDKYWNWDCFFKYTAHIAKEHLSNKINIPNMIKCNLNKANYFRLSI